MGIDNFNGKLQEAGVLLDNLSQIDRFSNKYGVAPSFEKERLCDRMNGLSESLPSIKSPKDNDELLCSEAKRVLETEASYLEQQLSGKPYDFDTVVKLIGVSKGDINSLRPWLEENRNDVLESVERLFNAKTIEGYELPLATDIPSVRRQSEEFAAAHIQKYHKTLGKFLQDLTNVGQFLNEIDAQPTTIARSYFHPLTKTLAIGIPSICFSLENGVLDIRSRDLIRLYGHEGMGHALNSVITDSKNLPRFLARGSTSTMGTEESVAQFYENRILEDLNNSPDIQEKLGIKHIFDRIYQEAKDIELLESYKSRLFYYGLTVLADKSFGDPKDPETIKKKTEVLRELALDKGYARDMIQSYSPNGFDSEGNLNSSTISELRYCARPVERALAEFDKFGLTYEGNERSVIDETFLTGFWTPIGFVDNARLKAQEIVNRTV